MEDNINKKFINDKSETVSVSKNECSHKTIILIRVDYDVSKPEEISKQYGEPMDTSDPADLTNSKPPTCYNILPPNTSSVHILANSLNACSPGKDNDNDNPNTQENTKANKRKRNDVTSESYYFDLSKDVVKEFASPPTSNPVDNDETFKSRLDISLDKPNGKRKLFTLNLYEDDINNKQMESKTTSDKTVSYINEVGGPSAVRSNTILDTSAKLLKQPSCSYCSLKVNRGLIEKNLLAINAHSAEAKMDEKTKSLLVSKKKNEMACKRHKYVLHYIKEYELKLSFLQSLEQSTPTYMCHPSALPFRSNFHQCKKILADVIYDIVNHKVFNCSMKLNIEWKKILTKPSQCLNTKNEINFRISVIHLSNVLIKNTEHLIVALVHEICHAAAWLYSGEIGHGDVCKAWILQVRQLLPEIPPIKNCGRLAHLYTYRCPLCKAKSQGSLKIKENMKDKVLCFYCYGPIQVDDFDAFQTIKLANDSSSFAQFIKKNYRTMMATTTTHSEIMQALNEQYNNLK